MKSNIEIAKLLKNTAILYEMEGVDFKPRAYEKVSQNIETYGEEMADLWKKGGRNALLSVSGIGPSIAGHIEEILKKGTFGEYERLRKKMPVNLEELGLIEGVGPKTILTLYKSLKIKNLKDLETAAKAGKIRVIANFGKKTEDKILKGIEFQKKSKGRFLLGEIKPIAKKMEEKIKKIPEVSEVMTCGSYRRWQETIGDIDIQVSSKKPAKVIERFLEFPEIKYVYGHGPTKVNVRLTNGIDADLRVVSEKSFGAALQYFTGDKMHNIELRKIAIKKGLKLNEYGLFRGNKSIVGRAEEEIYNKLGMEWMPPELRTASGEIEAAIAGKLPKLIPYGSIRGDLQVQTSWTDGSHTITEMVEAAIAAGLEYIAITDHTKTLAMTGGLDEKKLARQGKEIDSLNKKMKNFKILKSAEINILKNGEMDIADSALKKLDIVSCAVHSHFGMTETEMTERIIRAIKHPLVNILFHPTGRLIGRREAYKLDIVKVLRAAKLYGVALEVDASPDRLDLRDTIIRDAVKLGLKLVVDSDAHAPNHFEFLDYGVAQVRRGWGGTKDVLNTKPVDELLKALKGLKK